MLGSSIIQQYFATGNSHYVAPQVAFEWNYNLFYAPYVTSNNVYSPVTITDSWTSSNNTITTVPNGRTTSVFLNDTSLTTRSCISINTINGNGIKDTSNNYVTGFGTASITLSEISSTTNAYKITFYAKVDRDASVNLSALAYIDSHRAHSSSQTIDSVMWTKFEIYLSSQPLGTAYSSPSIFLHHEAIDGAQTYGILIDQFEVHQTTDFEYKYGNLWSTSAPFHAFRPGESYVPSGNSLCQLPNNFRKINTDLGIDSGSTVLGSTWNNQVMPVSPVVYHPTLLGTNSSYFNPITKNGSLSEWSRYKYFVSDTSTPTISASYDQLLNTNKIVIKFNTAYSTPSSFTVTLSGKTNTYTGGYSSVYSYSATYSSADIDSSGTCILYYQSNGSWLSGLNGGTWTGTVDTTTVPGTPSFDYQGNVKFGGAKGGTVNAIVQVNSIQVTQNTATVNSAYTSYTSVNESLVSGISTKVDKTAEFKRMQIIEVSPRLEIDVSYYTMSVQTQAELDNQQNPLPISQISSNMATVTLSNIPLVVSNSIVSLFSNNSSNSILKGLFKNYVKCYINYRIFDTVSGTTNADKVIPGGVFYVDTWDSTDIVKTVVTAYDITKYLQLVQPTDYVAQTEDGFRLISNILDFAGFTDYDFDSLKRVTSSTYVTTNGIQKTTSSPIRIRYFYADGTQQKVFDVLREIFEAYQIAAYIDAYGVMKFINIDQIFDTSNPINMQLHDTTGGVSVVGINGSTINDGYKNSLTIAPNIVADTFTEVTKTKVGKATLTYKTPQIEKTISSDPRLLNNQTFVDFAPTFLESTNAIWDSTIEDSTTYNSLYATMKSSDTFFYVNPSEAAGGGAVAVDNFRTYGIDHDGYAIIENEIVSFQYKELAFQPVGSNSPILRSVLNSAEFASQFAEVSGMLGNQSFSVQPTGRITRVNRGQFDTPVSDHVVMSSLSDIQNKFNTSSLTVPPYISSGNIALVCNGGSFQPMYANDSYASSNTYNTFSAKVMAGPNSNTNYPTGIQYGLIMLNALGSIRVYIQQSIINNTPEYLLYVTSNNTSLLSTSYINVTSIINEQSKYSLNAPFSDYGKYINIRFVKGSGSNNNAFEVYLNNIQVPLSTVSGITSSNLDTSSGYGMFVQNTGNATATVYFSELYATQTAILDPGKSYHYQLPWFAEKLSSNKKVMEISWMAQSSPTIVGINYYDIQDTQAPSLDAYPLKLSYDWYFYPNGTPPKPTGNTSNVTAGSKTIIVNDQIIVIPPTGNIANLPRISVNENALSYSPVYHSGFRSRFAIINCSPSQVFLKASPNPPNKINVDFSLITNSLITLGNDTVIEKVFDVANINETVDITSSWIQDKNTAVAVLRAIYRALESFSKVTTMSVYGNPLYEIGDIVVVNYKLKNILNKKYVVQGISQTFDTGLTTVLTLNQIADNPTVTLGKTYKTPGSLNGSLPFVLGNNNPVPTPITPSPVFSVSGTTGSTSGTFNINWANPPTGTASYNVTISGTASGSLSPNYSLTGVPTSITSESYTGGTPGALYNISVDALNSSSVVIGTATGYVNAFGGSSSFVATASTGASPGAFTIFWSGAPSGTTQYGVDITPSTTGLSPSSLVFTSSGTQSFTKGTPGGSYTATVTPYDSLMIPTAPAYPITVTAGASLPVPGTPTITYSLPTSTPVSAGFTVTWSSTNAVNYSVNVYNSNTGNSVAGYPTITSSTSAVLTGLVPNTQYSVSVQGINLSGNSQTFTNYTTTQTASVVGTFNIGGIKVGSGAFSVVWGSPPTGTTSYNVFVSGPNSSLLIPSYNLTLVPLATTAETYLYGVSGGTYTITVNALNSSSVVIGTASTTITA
jgi:hypothetical protein